MKFQHKLPSFIFLLACFIALSAFTMAHKEPTPPDIPKGNPDPDVGIVVRFDSTAKDIIADTSHAVRFTAMKRFKSDEIHSMATPISDFTSKKFTLVDDQLGFAADKIHKFTVSFGHDSKTWEGIDFCPFEPSRLKSESEIMPLINEWMARIDNAGWIRGKFIDGQGQQLPDKEVIYAWNYMYWKNDGRRIIMKVDRFNPGSHPNKADVPMYNLRIVIRNELTPNHT